MNDFSQARSIAASGMAAQAERLRFVSENLSNADTPGYRRKVTAFEEVLEAGIRTGKVQTGPVELDQTALERVYDPSHPLAGAVWSSSTGPVCTFPVRIPASSTS
ncbi:MAG: flagellar basal body protein, partial [Pseudomonadota bacterium]